MQSVSIFSAGHIPSLRGPLRQSPSLVQKPPVSERFLWHTTSSRAHLLTGSCASPNRVVLSLSSPGVAEGYVRSCRQSSPCPAEQRHAQRDGMSPTRGRVADPQPAPHRPAVPLLGAEACGPVSTTSKGPGALCVCVSNGVSVPEPTLCRPLLS